MFGTVGELKVKPENLDKLMAEMNDPAYQNVEGYRASYMLVDENTPGHVIVVAIFEDRDSYFKNAEDPAQHQRFLRYRDLLEEDPTWTDGEWTVASSE